MASSILLIRHAMPVPPVETMTEVEDDARSLSDEGRSEAELLAERLSGEPVTAVFSSPYRRAVETVQPIAAHHGLDVAILPDLRERRLSGGGPLAELEFLEALHRARTDPDFSLPGGESTREVLRRTQHVLQEIDRSTQSGVAVAGTHGGVISILRWSLGHSFSVEEALEEPMPSVFRVSQLDDTWAIGRLPR